MSKQQNIFIKLLRRLGLARFLGAPKHTVSETTVDAVSTVQASAKNVVEETPRVNERAIQSDTLEDHALESESERVVAQPVEVETSVQLASVGSDTSKSETQSVPEDSVLRRHYLAQQQAQREAITDPYPTDSVLRRHYDALHNLKLERCVKAHQAAAVTDTSRIVERAVAQAQEQAAEVAPASTDVTTLAAVTTPCTKAALIAKTVMPEDSVLKRHFLQQLSSEVEASLGPWPTDSILRRHHAGVVQSALEKRLS